MNWKDLTTEEEKEATTVKKNGEEEKEKSVATVTSSQKKEQQKKDETKKKTDATTTETKKKKIEIVIVNRGVFNYVLPTVVGTRATYYLVCIAIHCSLDISRNIPLEHSLPMVEKFPL